MRICVSGRDLGRHLRFMGGFVGQHRRPGHIADRKNVRHIGAHLFVDANDAARIHPHTGRGGVDGFTIGAAAHGDENAVEILRRRRVGPVDPRPQAGGMRLERGHLG